MAKKLNKPHVKNIRLDAPLGLLGVPPDAPYCGAGKTVMIVAELSNKQYSEMLRVLTADNKTQIMQ